MEQQLQDTEIYTQSDHFDSLSYDEPEEPKRDINLRKRKNNTDEAAEPKKDTNPRKRKIAEVAASTSTEVPEESEKPETTATISAAEKLLSIAAKEPIVQEPKIKVHEFIEDKYDCPINPHLIISQRTFKTSPASKVEIEALGNYIKQGIVAGGFAAFVAGRTNRYNDVDIYTFPGTEMATGRFIEKKDGKSNFIFMCSPPPREVYAHWVLMDFDMDICAVAYYLDIDQKVYRVERYSSINYTADNVLLLQKSYNRLLKYRERAVDAEKWKLEAQISKTLQFGPFPI